MGVVPLKKDNKPKQTGFQFLTILKQASLTPLVGVIFFIKGNLLGMLWNEIVSSVCICCSAALFSLSLQGQTKIRILFVQMFASILFLMNYLFAMISNSGAMMGAITSTFEIARLFVFFFIEKSTKYNTKKVNLIAMVIFSIVLTACSLFAWDGWISIFPLISAIIVSLALGNKNLVIIKIAFIIQAALISTYLLLISLWINAASQVVVLVLGVVGLVTYLNKNKQRSQSTNKC